MAPDGRRAAVISASPFSEARGYEASLRVVMLGSLAVTTFPIAGAPDSAAYAGMADPAWSPDGRLLLVARPSSEGRPLERTHRAVPDDPPGCRSGWSSATRRSRTGEQTDGSPSSAMGYRSALHSVRWQSRRVRRIGPWGVYDTYSDSGGSRTFPLAARRIMVR